MEEKDIIASNITYYRKKLGLSQLELAEKLLYSNKNISKWEKGETTPSIFTLKRLADIFGITVDQLIRPVEDASDEPLLAKKKKLSFKSKLVFLLLSNAILLVTAFLGIYILDLVGATGFNKWLLLVYITPLSALSVAIFIRCIFKYADFVSISIMVWATALSIFATFYLTKSIWFVFIVAGAFQLVIICIALLVNFSLIEKFKKRVKRNK